MSILKMDARDNQDPMECLWSKVGCLLLSGFQRKLILHALDDIASISLAVQLKQDISA
jgi:hypothetical protein